MSQQILFAPSVASVSGANQWSMVCQGRIFEPAEGRIQALIDDIVAPLVGASRTDGWIFGDRSGMLRLR